jgi:hypothetical protein
MVRPMAPLGNVTLKLVGHESFRPVYRDKLLDIAIYRYRDLNIFLFRQNLPSLMLGGQ